MQWRGRRQSGNVEDQRGRGGVGGMAFKGGLGTIAAVVVISLILGKNPLAVLQEMQTQSGGPATEQTNYQPTPEEEELGQFVRVVLADTEDVWNSLVGSPGTELEFAL